MRLLAAFVVLSFLLAACASPTPDPALLQTSVAGTLAAISTNTVPPTLAPTQTLTPAPTFVPMSTWTPKPKTPTPEATEYSLLTTGEGDMVLDIDKDDSPMLIHLVHTGEGNFAVWNLDKYGEKIDLLVNTIGFYNGTRPLDFKDDEHTARLQIEADSGGSWVVDIHSLALMDEINVPGNITGSFDNVIYLTGGTPDLLKVYAPKSSGNFAIKGYGDTVDLLVNEIAPYTGVVPLESGTFVLEIMATGDWAIQVTER